jgi:hypothetical protein
MVDIQHVLQDQAQGIFSLLQVAALDDHGLAWHVWDLDGVVHGDVVNGCLLDDDLSLALGCNSFSQVFILDENPERKDFSLLLVESLVLSVFAVV